MSQKENRANNYCTTLGTLTMTAGSVTTYDVATAFNYVLDGKIASKGSVTTGATPTTDFVTGIAFPALVGGASVAGAYGNGCIVLWGLISGGTVKCIMGRPSALAPLHAGETLPRFVTAPEFPSFPDTFVPFAYQVLKAGATASATAIIFGTANWNATGFTNAIVNLAELPLRPQVS